jgi:hypothetical protein
MTKATLHISRTANLQYLVVDNRQGFHGGPVNAEVGVARSDFNDLPLSENSPNVV